MKRITCLLLVFGTTVFAVAGCQPSGTKNDRPPIMVEAAADFIKPPRLAKAERLKKRDKGAPPPNFDTDVKTFLAPIGKQYVEYLMTGIAPKLTLENLKLSLQRQRLDDARQAVDDKSIEVVFLADPSYPKHIIAYKRDAEEAKNDVVFITKELGKADSSGLVVQLMKQSLETVLARYKVYVSQAPQRTLEGFMGYLKANAQPAIGEAISGGNIKVNINGNQLVACFGKADLNIGLQERVYGITGTGEIRPFTPDEVKGIFGR